MSEEVFAKKSPKRTKRRKPGELQLGDINLESLTSIGNETNKTLQEVYNERIKLEEFLFNENNKITKPSIKFILDKWSTLENRLQQQIMENELLKTKEKLYETHKVSYAQVASSVSVVPGACSKLDPTKQKRNENYEVILLKPEKDSDKRNNDELKKDVIEKLKDASKKLKVRNIRQMKQKGIVIQVSDKNYVKLNKESNLESIGLKVEKPKKINPSIIIYDVEKDYKKEELLENFVNKNLDENLKRTMQKLKEEIDFRHCFKVKEDKVNWVVQVPSEVYLDLLNKGKVYMFWRFYRLREFLNTLRCFKCHATWAYCQIR